MDPVSNVDALVLILRQRLEERARAQSTTKTERLKAPEPPFDSGVRSVEALASLEGVSDHQLGRALIQSVLTEHFGADLLNEAKFQRVIDQVTETIEQEPDAARLLGRTLGELRSGAR